MATSSGLEKCLTVGLDVFLDAQPGQNNAPRYPGRIRGWEEGQYILFGLNRGARLPVVRRGSECVVRFMHEGEVWGFTAAVGEALTQSEYPLIQLHWPSKVARIQVRKHERAPIHIPCTLHVGEESEDCFINDISSGGCSVVATRNLSVSDTMHLSFRMPDGGVVSRRPVIIRNRREESSGTFAYGCQFQEEKEEDRGIELFVKRKIAMDRGEAAPHPQLLVLSRNDEDIQAAQHGLLESPYQAVMATGILDLGYRLKTCNTVGILVSFEQKELSAIEIIPLISASQEMEGLPLFLYGGGKELHAQATEAGAALCLDSLEQIQDVLPHLPALPEPPPPEEEEVAEAAPEHTATDSAGGAAAPETEEEEAPMSMESPSDELELGGDDDDDDDDGDEIDLG